MNRQKLIDLYWITVMSSVLVGVLFGVGFYLFFSVVLFGPGAR
jgi:hypothetical protein